MSESFAYGEDTPRSLLAVGDAGLALRSDDAGQSWRRIDVGTQADLRAAAVGYPLCRRARDEGGRPQRTVATGADRRDGVARPLAE